MNAAHEGRATLTPASIVLCNLESTSRLRVEPLAPQHVVREVGQSRYRCCACQTLPLTSSLKHMPSCGRSKYMHVQTQYAQVVPRAGQGEVEHVSPMYIDRKRSPPPPSGCRSGPPNRTTWVLLAYTHAIEALRVSRRTPWVGSSRLPRVCGPTSVRPRVAVQT